MAHIRAIDEQVSPRLRFAVLTRDAFMCQYCGRTPDDGVKLHIDHIFPVCEGGKSNPDNLVTACQDCNLGKGPLLVKENPISLKRKGHIVLVKRNKQKENSKEGILTEARAQLVLQEEDIIENFAKAQRQQLRDKELSIIFKRIRHNVPDGYRHLLGLARGLIKLG